MKFDFKLTWCHRLPVWDRWYRGRMHNGARFWRKIPDCRCHGHTCPFCNISGDSDAPCHLPFDEDTGTRLRLGKCPLFRRIWSSRRQHYNWKFHRVFALAFVFFDFGNASRNRWKVDAVDICVVRTGDIGPPETLWDTSRGVLLCLMRMRWQFRSCNCWCDEAPSLKIRKLENPKSM